MRHGHIQDYNNQCSKCIKADDREAAIQNMVEALEKLSGNVPIEFSPHYAREALEVWRKANK